MILKGTATSQGAVGVRREGVAEAVSLERGCHRSRDRRTLSSSPNVWVAFRSAWFISQTPIGASRAPVTHSIRVRMSVPLLRFDTFRKTARSAGL